MNTEQPRGVSLTSQGRWISRLFMDGKQVHLGSFDTMDEAREAYVIACRENGKEHLIDRKPIAVSKGIHQKRKGRLESLSVEEAEMVLDIPLNDTLDKLKSIQNAMHQQIKDLTERIEKLEF